MAKVRQSVTLSSDAKAWAEATGNLSAYVDQAVLVARDRWRLALDATEGWTRPMRLAAMEVVEYVPLTTSPAAELAAALRASDELQDRWALTDEQWGRLLALTDVEAEAVRVLAAERSLGRPLP